MKDATIVWHCAGVSAAGVSHLQAGTPCQDHCNVGISGSTRRVVALSDGAGSAQKSQVGAKIAVDTIARLLTEHAGPLPPTEDQAAQFGKQVRQAISQQSTADQCKFSDYACTLLVAALEDGNCYFWQIGDGAWILQTTSKAIECATWPCKGEFNNQTAFITSDDWESHWTQAFVENVSAIVGFTDGMEMFCLDNATQKPHLPFVERILSALGPSPAEAEVHHKIEQMLHSPLIRDREDDDLTLVLAWRGSRNVPG